MVPELYRVKKKKNENELDAIIYHVIISILLFVFVILDYIQEITSCTHTITTLVAISMLWAKGGEEGSERWFLSGAAAIAAGAAAAPIRMVIAHATINSRRGSHSIHRRHGQQGPRIQGVAEVHTLLLLSERGGGGGGGSHADSRTSPSFVPSRLRHGVARPLTFQAIAPTRFPARVVVFVVVRFAVVLPLVLLLDRDAANLSAAAQTR